MSRECPESVPGVSGGGVYFAVLLGIDNSYTTPSKIPLLDWMSFVVVVYGWWSPNRKMLGNEKIRPKFF